MRWIILFTVLLLCITVCLSNHKSGNKPTSLGKNKNYPDRDAEDECGRIQLQIKRNSGPFKRLIKYLTSSQRVTSTLDNSYVTSRLKLFLDRLLLTVSSEDIIDIIQGWSDEIDLNDRLSLRYEGRSLRFRYRENNSANRLRALAGFAIEAGCDWVRNQDDDYITCCVRPDDCRVPIDLTFMLDTSGSVGRSNHIQATNFISNVVQYFNIGYNATQVALIPFATYVHSYFFLDSFSDKFKLQAQILSTSYSRGWTNTWKALYVAENYVYTSKYGVRPISSGVPRVAIILTDGKSNGREAVPYAESLRNASVTVFSVGIGSGIDQEELRQFASQPVDDHVIQIDSYPDIEEFVNRLSAYTCTEPGPTDPGNNTEVELPEDDFRYFQAMCSSYNHSMNTITIEETNVNGTCSLYVSINPDNKNPGPLTDSFTTLSNTSDLVLKHIILESGINTTIVYITLQGTGTEMNTCTVTIYHTLFNDTSYDFSLPEDVYNDRVLGTLTAEFISTDFDYAYSIIPEKDYNFFTIDSTTGLLTVSGTFDFEEKETYQYQASVLVEDPTENCIKGRTTVNLFITDINDNPPTFDQEVYTVHILETDNEVIILSAVDKDDGINAELTYSFGDSNPNTDFAISSEGVVTVLGSLDGFNMPFYQYTVVATDSGEPTLSGTATLMIYVDEVNSQPIFTGCSYEDCVIYLSEDIYQGDLLNLGYFLSATDPDSGGLDAELTWSGGSPPFEINSDTGELILTGALDRETESIYELMFIVSDGGNPSLSVTVTVTAIVTDVNDNPPVFDQESYSGEIVENVGPMNIFRVETTDIDDPFYNEVMYSLFGSNSQYFYIDEDGVVSTNQAFDFESLPSSNPIQFYIRATDGEFIVEVPGSLTITDVNDNSPIITGDSTATLLESTSLDTVVFNLTVTDADSGGNGEVTVLLEGNQDELFLLDYDHYEMIAIITLERELDFETSRFHTLRLRATDGGDPARITSLELYLTVLDINDNAPICGQDITSTLREDVAINTQVGHVQVTDEDKPDSPNSQISYSITAVNNTQTNLQLFSISSNGLVKTNATLDIETTPQYVITITASDNGNPMLSCMVDIVLTLEDVNEFPPVINTTASTLNVTVREDTPEGTLIATVTATDADFTSGGIVYVLTNPNFGINSQTGQISVTSSLDFETTPFYNLIVIATDGNNEQTAVIAVQVLNINDITPTVDIESPLLVPEDLPVGSNITCFDIIDGDGEANGEFSVSFSGAGSSLLSYNNADSCILLAEVLDREGTLGNNFVVSAIVNDHGVPNLHSTTEFILEITDVNDNPPTFEPSVLSTSVPENTAIGTAFFSVLATDRDNGINADIVYEINSTQFSIDNDGAISVNDEINFEVTNTIVLHVVASDLGDPSLSGTAIVVVEVIDVNDNLPILTNLPDTVNIQENGEDFVHIFQVTSSDLDTDINSQNPEYSIMQISPNNVPDFQFYGDYIIADTSVFDREAIPSYSLTISASDGSNSATSTLTILVTDENDNSPMFLGESSFSIRECIQDCNNVFTIQTSDSDGAGTSNAYLYTVDIFNTNSFTADIISPNTIGVSCFQNTLDFETTPTLSFILQATDGGHSHQLSTNVTIQVVVLDCNDNFPVFSPSSIEVDLPEDVPINTVIATFNANDIDTGLAGVISYRQDLDSTFFTINATTGNVTLIRSLDYESDIMHLFYVIASDSGSPSLSTESVLQVNVINVNDNLPVFDLKEYTLCLPEDTETFIYSDIMVTDADGDTIIFSIEGSSPFNITDEFSSNLTLTSELDFEEQDYYHFSILARNDDSTEFVSADVVLFVLDVNDNPPVITNGIFEFSIREDTEYGVIVFTATAEDPDSGENGEFHFFQNNITEFDITPDGVVTTSIIFDRESIDNYQLNITVQDMGDPTMNSTQYFTIGITDFNDNIPQFNLSEYSDSISESALPGTLLQIMIFVTDSDLGENAEIDLTDDSSVFNVTELGYVMLVSPLDFESRDSYTFTVTATDRGTPSLSNTVNCTVMVLNENDNPPVFSPSEFLLYIEEYNQLTDTHENLGVIFTPLATDADNDMLTYSYDVIFGPDFFSINSTTGEISASYDIDRETNPQFEINITASDGVFTSSAFLVLIVTDVNDNFPYFVSPDMNISVSEGIQTDTNIAIIEVIDRDIELNGEVVLSIEQTYPINESSVLEILQDGQLILSSVLDFETITEYAFLIAAADMGSESLTNTTTFTIRVSDVNDNYPVFAFNNYSVMIEENTTPSQLLCVSATDADSGVNSQLTYFILDSSQVSNELENAFNFSGCNLSVVESFDFEQIQSFYIIIGARDAGTPSLTSSVQLYVEITDLNDNNPEFIGDYPDPLLVSENIDSFTIILFVEASDLDSGSNGEIIFSLVEDPIINETFNISIQGDLYVIDTLDFETTERYLLTIIATDMGDIPRSSYLNLTIQVVNENDNMPMFNQSSYEFYIPEDADITTLIGQTPATDGDSGLFGDLIYSIVNGPNVVIYYNDAELYTEIVLDRETRSSYSLQVQVQDGGDPSLFDTAYVTITVLDVNDNAPLFDNDSISVPVPENAPIDSIVVELHATDADEANTPNSQITFLLNDTSFYLDTDSTSGIVIIRTDTVLDRETQSVYFIQVTATDNGFPSLSSNANITVIIGDIDDNAPVFNDTSANVTLPESTVIETLVATFSASDLDTSSTIIYTIQPADTFYINASGSVFLATSLDFETTQFYNLTINATDGTSSSLATLLVYVTDVNEYIPSFLQNYTTTVYENLLDEIIVTVEATDSDGSSLLVYSISGDRADEFQIDPTFGDVIAREPLDREDARGHIISLMIQVSDSGAPPLTGFASLIIEVLDVNDNSPEFINFPSNLTLPEDTTNSNLVQIQAMDADTGVNAHITYSLYMDFDLFNITSTGQLQLINWLDYETTTSYDLLVIATDGGTIIALSSNATIQIIVTDVNDNSPVFQNGQFLADVLEHSLFGTIVFTGVATDADYSINSQLTFSLSTNSYLIIDTVTGQVTVDGEIDRELVNSINVTVTVCDGGLPTRCTNEQLIVTVIDINDQNPQFGVASETVEVIEGISAFIYQQIPTDNDDPNTENSQIVSYTISPVSSGFTVSNEGEVFSPELDYETMNYYQLQITATDGGDSSLTGFYILLVMVTDINDNSPVITIDPIELFVLEDQPPSSLNVSISATDEDSGANGDVTFSLIEADTPFSLTPEGELSLFGSLDYDTGVQSYTLTILAVDGGSPSLNSTATLEIIVGEVNDNSPVFDQSSYQANVLEEQNPLYFVVGVSATDSDFNSTVSYSLSDYYSSFEITSNGTIYGIESIDFESEQMIMFDVIATDDGTPPRSTEVLVTLNIIDINDNAPEIQTQVRVINVSETISTPNVLLFLSAVDPDSGPNGEVFFTLDSAYSIFMLRTEGNPDELILSESLDFEQLSLYMIYVTAHDRGDQELNSTIAIEINVINENDNTPLFNQTEYSGSVREDEVIDYVVVTVEANDADLGILGMIDYSISQNNFFSINQQGEILVSNVIDADPMSSIQFSVTACDRGSPPICTSVYVNISLVDVNDNAPEIDDPSDLEIFIVSENYTGFIVEIFATDGDRTAPNNMLTYSILSVSNNGANFFTIDSEVLLLYNPVDFEALAILTFNLTIIVSDGGSPSLNSTVFLQIEIEDFNDNPPLIANGPFSIDLEENQQSYPSAEVSATDADSGLNSQFLFSISDTSLVSINQDTGVVTFNGPFDFEVTSEYVFTITVTDLGIPVLSSSTELILYILDVNDHSPIFSMSTYEESIPESTGEDETFLTVLATDADGTVDNSIIAYSITPVNQSYFQINNQGEISLFQNLDFETLASHTIEFNVFATDNGYPSLSSSTIVRITVTDSNDNAPQIMPPANPSILEGTSLNTVLTTIQATDGDSGINAVLNFSITNSVPFSIDENNGNIIIADTLDRETQDFYSITILVEDNGTPSLSSDVTINVTILDRNDNFPVFLNAPYEFFVPENASFYTIVGIIEVSDADIGDNAELICYLSSIDNPFVIYINDSERLLVSGQLDRETQSTYSLTVSCQDISSSPLISTASIVVTITDINDKTPQFPESQYDFLIREDINAYTEIGQIQATDLDEADTLNSQVEFYSTEENDDNYFLITTEGLLMTNNLTERIPLTNFTLIIVATDLGSPPLSNSTQVFIGIIDVNDVAPTFNTTDIEVIRISEYTPVGENIANFTAIDLEGTVITYSLITEYGTDGDFRVDPTTGGLFVNQSLDYERDIEYTLRLIAVDSPDEEEGAARTGMVNIPVFIIDENDNSPIFQPDSYAVNISENQVGPIDLVMVSATDLDSGVNGDITYSLTLPSALSGLISINSSTGIVSLVNGVSFDFEGSVSNEFFIPVTAIDQGNPSNPDSGETVLTINIIDINDHTPQINPFYFATIYENLPANTNVTLLQATDLDTGLNGEIEYFFLDSNISVPFSIDINTGAIVSTAKLDREDIASYSFVVTAADRGDPVRINTTIVNVTVKDVNDNCPTVESEDNVLGILEESSGEVLNNIIEVVDEDIGLNGEYNFSLSDPFHLTLFSINTETGQLSLLQQLDREDIDQYNLTILITDRGAVPCTTTTFVIIIVQDENDNRATFIGTPYNTNISEGVPLQTPVICVAASDPDLGGNGEFTFQLVGISPFTIHPNTGCIVTSGEIDREINPQFSLEVRAVEFNNNLFSTASVEVIVIDGNDNTPKFTQNPYTFNVVDLTTLSPIGILTAMDGDEGINRELSYEHIQLESTSTQQMYQFNVADNGISPLSSTTGVIINFPYCEFLEIATDNTNNEVYIYIRTLCSATVELISTLTVLNSTVSLNCIVVGNIPFEVQWLKDGSIVQELSSVTMLDIDSLSIADEGQYTCQAIVPGLVYIQSEPYSLVVQIPPEITIPPNDLAINQGDTLTLSCYSTGVPDPDHLWSLSDDFQYIIDLDSPDVTGFNVTQNQITYPDITIEQEGYYTCNASNAVGYDVETGHVIIHVASDLVTIGFNNNFSNPDPNNGGCNNLDTSLLSNILSGITGTSTTITASSGDSNLCDSSGGTTTTTTTTTTLCNPNQCNGYQCTLNVVTGFVCDCPGTLGGITCNIDNDECSGIGICQNDAVCTNLFNGFTCTCQSGYTGDTCEIPTSCTEDPCPADLMCVDTVDGFDCVITQNVTVNTTNEQSANNVAEMVNDEQSEELNINRRRRQTGTNPDPAYRNCVVIVSREVGSTVVTLVIGCLERFALSESDLLDVCQYLYDSYANFQSCSTPMGNVLIGPKTPPSSGVTISVILTNPTSGEVIPGTTAVELIVNGINDASSDDTLSKQLIELGFPEPDLTQITASSLPPIPIEYTGIVIGILSILFILLVVIIVCICLVVCVKRRSKKDKVTSYDHSGVIEPKPKATDLELGPSTELRDISTEPENEYGLMEQAVTITTFDNPIAEEPEVEVQAKPTLASKFSFQKKITPTEETVSLVPSEPAGTTEATNVVAQSNPVKKPEIAKSDSFPKRMIAATTSFGKKKDQNKIEAAPLIDEDTGDIESKAEPVPENLPEKLPRKLPPKKKIMEPQSPTINECESVAGALVPAAERDMEYKGDQLDDVYSNVNVKADATMAQLWETAIKDGEKQDKKLVAGKKLISVQSQEDLQVKQPISESSSPPSQPTSDNIEHVVVAPVQPSQPVIPTQSTQATSQPSSPQKIEHSLTYPWYYSDLNREAAEIKLMQLGEEGGFLVRAASSAKGDYSLSVLVSYKEPLIKHLLIRDIGTELVLQAQGAKTNFPHLAALVAYYSMEEFVFADLQKNIKLTHPVLK